MEASETLTAPQPARMEAPVGVVISNSESEDIQAMPWVSRI
jgi:hypothetical protein